MAQTARDFVADSFYAFLKEERRLMGVRCRRCGALSVEPRPMCQSCHGDEMEWFEFSGRGRLSTFTCIYIVPVRMGEKGTVGITPTVPVS